MIIERVTHDIERGDADMLDGHHAVDFIKKSGDTMNGTLDTGFLEAVSAKGADALTINRTAPPTIKTSLDGRSWEQITNNGDPIPGVNGNSMTGKTLLLSEEFNTKDPTRTPVLKSCNVRANGATNLSVIEQYGPDFLSNISIQSNFQRGGIAFNNNRITQVAANVPRFETKGLTLEGPTTNLLSNSNFSADSNSDGLADTWTAVTDTATPSFSIVTWDDGRSAQQITVPANTHVDWNSGISHAVTLAPSTTYTVSFDVCYIKTSNYSTKWKPYCTNLGFIGDDIVQTKKPYRHIVTFTTNGSGESSFSIVHSDVYSTITDGIQIANIQLEQNPYTTSWTTAARAAESLTIPTANVINLIEGCIEVVVNVNDAMKNANANHVVFAHYTSGVNNALFLFHDAGTNQWRFWTTNAAGTTTSCEVLDSAIISADNTTGTLTGGQHRFTCRWSKDESALLIDGIKQDSKTNPNLPTVLATNMYIGSYDGTEQFIDGQITSFIVSSRWRNDGEAMSRGSVDQIPVDIDTTCMLPLISDVNNTTGTQLVNVTVPHITKTWDDNKTTNQTVFGADGCVQSASNGQLHLRAMPGVDVRVRFDDMPATADFVAQFDICCPSVAPCNGGFLYRTSVWCDTVNAYGYYVGMGTDGKLLFAKSSNTTSTSWTWLSNTVTGFTPGKWYTIKVIVNGTRHIIQVNGVTKIDMNDSTHIAPGLFGLRVGNNGQYVDFDNLSIYANGLQLAQQGTDAVDAKDSYADFTANQKVPAQFTRGTGTAYNSDGTLANAVAWSDDFSTDKLAQYDSTGDTPAAWFVSGGQLQVNSGSPVQALLLKSGTILTDGEIEANFTAAHDGGLVLRHVDNNNYYMVTARDDSGVANNFVLYKRFNGAFTAVATNDNTWARDTNAKLKLRAVGNILKVYYNDTEILSYTDSTSPFMSGRAGIRCCNSSAFAVSDVAINDLTKSAPRFDSMGIVSEGTTNILPANVASPQLAGFDPGYANEILTIVSDPYKVGAGTTALKVETPGEYTNEGAWVSNWIDVTPGTYTLSYYICGAGQMQCYGSIRDGSNQSAGDFWDNQFYTLSNTPTRYSQTIVVPANGVKLDIIFVSDNGPTADIITFYLSGIQLEKKDHVTDWVAGDSTRADVYANGLLVEESTTNLLTLAPTSLSASGLTMTSSSDYMPFGTNSAKCVNASATSTSLYQNASLMSLTSGTNYTVKSWVKTGTVQTGTQMRIILWRSDYSSAIGSSFVTVTSNTEYVFIGNGTFGTSGNCFVSVDMNVPVGNTTDTFYCGAVQVEQKAYATSYAGVGGTRGAETSTISTANVLSLNEGTIEFLLNVTGSTQQTGIIRDVVSLCSDAATYKDMLCFWRSDDGYWNFSIYDHNGQGHDCRYQGTLSVGMHRFVGRWSVTNNEFAMNIDGVEYDPQPYSTYVPTVLADELYIGSWVDGTSQISTQISDFMISDISRTDAEIDARKVLTPLGADAHTTVYMPLNDSLDDIMTSRFDNITTRWFGGVASQYAYYKTHVINGSADGNLSSYQVKFDVYSGIGTDANGAVYLGGHALCWPNDIRFTNASGVLLDYWIESNDGTHAVIWVEVDSIPTTGATIYLWYGKDNDQSMSSGPNTFPLFDHFDGTSLDTSKWANTGCTVSVTSGALTITGTGETRVTSIPTFSKGAFMASMKNTAGTDIGLLTKVGATTSYLYRITGIDGANRASIFAGFTWVALQNTSYTVPNWTTNHIHTAYFDGLSLCHSIDHGATTAKITDSKWTTPGGVGFRVVGSNTTVVDWAAVRNITPNEPAHAASWGAETSNVLSNYAYRKLHQITCSGTGTTDYQMLFDVYPGVGVDGTLPLNDFSAGQWTIAGSAALNWTSATVNAGTGNSIDHLVTGLVAGQTYTIYLHTTAVSGTPSFNVYSGTPGSVNASIQNISQITLGDNTITVTVQPGHSSLHIYLWGHINASLGNTDGSMTVDKVTISNIPNVVYLNSHSLSWPNDLRFTTEDGLTQMDYWIESYGDSYYEATYHALIWVKIPSLPANSTTNMYIYYGRNGDVSMSNGDRTFQFFDDFEATAGTVNLLTYNQSNGGEDTTTTGFGNYNSTMARDASVYYQGASSIKWTIATAGQNGSIHTATTKAKISPGVPYTASVYAKCSSASASTITMYIWWMDAAGNVIRHTGGDVTTVNNSTWTRCTTTRCPPQYAVYAYVEIYGLANANGDSFWGDNLQFERGTIATTWVAGGVPGVGSTNLLPASMADLESYTPISFPAAVTAYTYRKRHTITSVTDGAQTNYQMKFTLYRTGTGDSAGSVYLNSHSATWTASANTLKDIRFTNSAGTLLDYWIESDNGTSAVVWVEVDTIAAAGSDVYIYYGRSGDTGASSGANTFLVFDDFSSDTNANYTKISDSGFTPSWSYDSTNKCLKQTNTASSSTFLIHTGSATTLSSATQGYHWHAKVRIYTDNSGRNHAGLIIDAATTTPFNFYRMTYLDSSIYDSKFIGGTETSLGAVADAAVYADNEWITHDVYRKRGGWLNHWMIKDSNGYTNGHYCSGSESSRTSGGVGFHCYGGQIWVGGPAYVTNWTTTEPVHSTWYTEETNNTGVNTTEVGPNNCTISVNTTTTYHGAKSLGVVSTSSGSDCYLWMYPMPTMAASTWYSWQARIYAPATVYYKPQYLIPQENGGAYRTPLSRTYWVDGVQTTETNVVTLTTGWHLISAIGLTQSDWCPGGTYNARMICRPACNSGGSAYDTVNTILYDCFQVEQSNVVNPWVPGTMAGLDTSKWNTYDGTGLKIQDGVIQLMNTSAKVVSNATFGPGYTLEAKHWTYSIPTNGYTPIGFVSSTTDGVSFLNHPTNKYYRNDAAWVSAAGEYPTGAYMLYRIDSGAYTTNLRVSYYNTDVSIWDIGGITNTVGAEPIFFGKRQDEGPTYLNQSFSAVTDWIRVRKYLPTLPTHGAWGGEENTSTHSGLKLKQAGVDYSRSFSTSAEFGTGLLSGNISLSTGYPKTAGGTTGSWIPPADNLSQVGVADSSYISWDSNSLAANSGFETGDLTSWSGFNAGYPDTSRFGVTVTNATAYTGHTYSAHFVCDMYSSGAYFGIVQEGVYGARAGETHVVSAWVKGWAEGPISFIVDHRDSGGNLLRWDSIAWPTPFNYSDWTLIEFTTTAAPAGSTYFRPHIWVNGTCDFYVDAYRLYPTNQVKVETSMDGGSSWATCTNHAQIPNIQPGTNCTGKNLLIKATLTSDAAQSYPPLISSLSVSVTSQCAASGTWISRPILLSDVKSAVDSSASWSSNVPSASTITVYTSTDNEATWSTVNNYGTISTLSDVPVDCAGKTVQLKVSMNGNGSASPTLSTITTNVKSAYESSGYRISPAIDMSPLGTAATSTITWQSTPAQAHISIGGPEKSDLFINENISTNNVTDVQTSPSWSMQLKTNEDRFIVRRNDYWFDDFNDEVLNPAYTKFGSTYNVWLERNNVLTANAWYCTNAASGIQINNMNYLDEDMEILTKLKVSRIPFNSDRLYRVGPCLKTDSSGNGYRFLMTTNASGVPCIGLLHENVSWYQLTPYTFSANTWYWMKFRVTGAAGSRSMYGKIWLDGTSEPAAWTLTQTGLTDTTNQGAQPMLEVGSLGNKDYTVSFDNVSVYRPGTATGELLSIDKSGTPLINGLVTPGNRSSTLVVAASDASQAVKNTADYVCDGIADEVQINAATAALPAGSYVNNLLTANQSNVETDTTGFTGHNATIARSSTQKWQGSYSLSITSGGSSSDCFADVGGDGGAFRLGMLPGFTYTMSAYVYVPAATGLSPDHARGLKITGFVLKADDTYTEVQGGRPTSTDAWQRITCTITIPGNAKTAFFRLYNGFAAAEKVVYYDGIQLECKASASAWQLGGTITSTGGGNVILSEGTFNLSNYINLGSGFVTLAGNSMGGTKLTMSPGYGTSVGMISAATGASHVTVENLVLDGNKANQTNTTGALLQFGGACNLNIRSIEGKNSKADAVYIASGSANVSINNVTAHDCDGAGISIVGASDFVVSNCNAYGNGSSGGGFYATNAYNGVFMNCTSNSNTYSGIYLDGATAYLVVSGCSCDSNGVSGILSNGSLSSIVGCTVSNNTQHGIASNVGQNLLIRGNTANGNDGDGITVYGAAGTSKGYSITGNAAYNNSGFGICANGLTETVVYGNACYYNNLHGIYLCGTTTYSSVASNICYENSKLNNNQYSNICLDASNYNLVYGNKCYKGDSGNLASVGIAIGSGSANVVFGNDLLNGGASAPTYDGGTGTVWGTSSSTNINRM